MNDLEDIITAENLGNSLNEANDLLKENEVVEEEIIKANNDVHGRLSREVDGLIDKGHHDPEGVRGMVASYADS